MNKKNKVYKKQFKKKKKIYKDKVTLIEKTNVIDITWDDWEGKNFMKCFIRKEGGDYFKASWFSY